MTGTPARLLGAFVLFGALAFVSSVSARADDASDVKLQTLVAGAQRSPEAKARDPFRHPYEVLHFFGLAEDQTVVEIWPGGAGFWTEILAPYLHDKGIYYAAVGEDTTDEARKANATFAAKLAAHPEIYGKVVVITFAGERHEIAPAGSADLVVTFRNLHNWMADHDAEAAFRTFYKALNREACSASKTIAAAPTSRRMPTPRAATSARTMRSRSRRPPASSSPAAPK